MARKSRAGNVMHSWKIAEYKFVRTLDRRKRAGKDIIDNGDIPPEITLPSGERVWSFR
ncbi:MAG: hypothetical protein ACQ5SW_07785 [Sphaerochaetaceae bacterium]